MLPVRRAAHSDLSLRISYLDRRQVPARVIAVAHRAARRDLGLGRVFTQMAGAAGLDVGQQQIARRVGLRRRVAGSALFLFVVGVVEPAVRHVARRLGDRQHPFAARVVAFGAYATNREHTRGERHRSALRRGEVAVVKPAWRKFARSPASAGDRPTRRTVGPGERGAHLADVAVREGTEVAAGAVTDETAVGVFTEVLLLEFELELGPETDDRSSEDEEAAARARRCFSISCITIASTVSAVYLKLFKLILTLPKRMILN